MLSLLLITIVIDYACAKGAFIGRNCKEMSLRKRKRIDDSSEENASAEKMGGGLLSTKIESATTWCRSRPDPSMLCSHCDTLLSMKTYRRHKRLYYDSATDTWQKLDVQGECTGACLQFRLLFIIS